MDLWADEEPPTPPPGKPGIGRGLKLAITAALFVGAASALYVIASAGLKPAGEPGLQSLARGGMEKLSSTEPRPPPAKGFVDAEGATVRIADFQGEVLVVNLWATWCAPCKIEMPTLAALQTAYEGRPVRVMAISIDRPGETEAAKAFIAENAPLDFYQDSSLELPYAFDPYVVGFPTTVVYDRSGMERARLVGEADWSTAEAKAVVDHLLTLN